MGLEQLMDGALCTGILVEADADTLATAFAEAPVPPGDDSPRILIAELGGIGWCRVELGAEVAATARSVDSDPLLAEAASAMGDTATDGAWGVDTPVRVAREVSRRLGVAAIGIWASDQGPGIGGAVRFDAGTRTWCFSAASPEEIAMIDRLRELEEQEGELSEELEEQFEALDERAEERAWSAAGEIAGEVSEHVDKALADLGMDPDWIEEPLWTLTDLPDLPSEVTRLVRID